MIELLGLNLPVSIDKSWCISQSMGTTDHKFIPKIK